jgi:hypothetical protein
MITHKKKHLYVISTRCFMHHTEMAVVQRDIPVCGQILPPSSLE